MAWVATTGGISGGMIRDLMPACVERRFVALRAPRPVQCHESNGVSEVFVKTLKRDYTRIHPRPDDALQQALA